MTPVKIFFLTVLLLTASTVCFFIAEQPTQANRSLAFAVVTLAFAFAARIAERQLDIEPRAEFARQGDEQAAAPT